MSNPVDWFDLLPYHIAVKQIAWEKRRRVWFAAQSGATRKVIASHLGVSTVRIQQQVERGRGTKDTSPAAAFLSHDLITEIKSQTFRRVAGDPRARQKRIAEHFAMALVTTSSGST